MIAKTQHPVEQIVDILDAWYWDHDEERGLALTAALDEEGRALLAILCQHWMLAGDCDDYCGLCCPESHLLDMAIAYSRTGDDPEIASRLRDCVDEDLHKEQLARMEAAAITAMAALEGGAA